MPRRILCFGDSNTFGWIGRLDGPTRRFPSDIRWTGRISSLLGPDYEIIPVLVLTAAMDVFQFEAIGGKDMVLPVCSGDMLFNAFDEYMGFLN
jgi:hypothetical protein